MEELVRGHGGKLAGIGLERCAAEFDGGGVGVLHAAVAAIRREVEEEKVVLERTVLHPSGLGVYDFAESVGEAGQVTKIGGGVDYDAVMAAVFDESRFLELAEFDGRVDEGVVVGGLKVSLAAWERRRHVPAGGDGGEADGHGGVASIGGVHQDFGEIEEGVLGVELCAEGAGLVS